MVFGCLLHLLSIMTLRTASVSLPWQDQCWLLSTVLAESWKARTMLWKVLLSPLCRQLHSIIWKNIHRRFFMQYNEGKEVFSRLTAIWRLSLTVSLKVLIFAALCSWKQACTARHHINYCSSNQFTYVMILLVENPPWAELYQSC